MLMWLAVTFNLIREERQSRMHMRFRVAGLRLAEVLGKGTCSEAGFLGQARHHRPDAIGIMEATVLVFRTFCTKYADPPLGAQVEPEFLLKDFEHMLEILEAISVDSAENEIVSVKDINRLKPKGSREITVLRDACHSARRVLSRLFKADPILKCVFNFFGMMATIIQWSLDLRTLYSECTAESQTSAVRTKFSHLRAAKHRIETWLTPLSRSTLDPDGD